jgi:formamidopyrimidine-DNA glycosylase
MPELPEVHTTVEGLKKKIVGKTIQDVWSDFHIGTNHGHKDNLKNKKYYETFKKEVVGAKIKSIERRGKNILINLNNQKTIVVHMKMTGHLMVGRYEKQNSSKNLSAQAKRKITAWLPLKKGPLQDSYNRFIHFVVSLSDGKKLVLSDMRKFASICLVETEKLFKHQGLQDLGPDPLRIGVLEFIKIIRKADSKKNTPIKDQKILAGIGNIYSDEILWESAIHPLSISLKIPDKKLREIFAKLQKILHFSISKGGDSKSDYRNIDGERGGFQQFHKAYGRKNEACPKKGCRGIIKRLVIRGRSAHFCPVHQKIYG